MSPIDMETLRSNPVIGKLLEQAVAEARARNMANALFIVLDEREIPLADAHRERIVAMTDAEQLLGLVRAAMHVASADELFTWEQESAAHRQLSTLSAAPHRASTGNAHGADARVP